MTSRVPIRPRLLIGSFVVALLISIGGGYALSRMLDDDAPLDAAMEQPGEYTEPTLAAESAAGDAFPDVEVLALDGTPVRTGSLVGTPMVVNLWYAGCPPCERELPAFAEVSAEYGRQVRFVGINLLDPPELAAEFAAEKGVEFEQYRDETGAYSEAIRAVAYPMTVFVDAGGTVVEQTGVLDAEGLRSRVEDLL